MRSMLDMEIPLNAGCLVPLDSKRFTTGKIRRSLLFFLKSESQKSRYCHLLGRQLFAVGMS